MATHLGHADQLMYFAAAEGVSMERVRLDMLERMVEPCGPRPRSIRGTADGEKAKEGKPVASAAASASSAGSGDTKEAGKGSSGLVQGSDDDGYDLDDAAAGRGAAEDEDEGGSGAAGGHSDGLLARSSKGVKFVPASSSGMVA